MIDLQGGAKAPLYAKIYEHIRQEIMAGRIPQGEKLPSTRLLAKNLAVSRSTVELAYDQLLAEGYLKAEPCRGFFVCDITELYRLGERKAAPTEDESEKKKEEERAAECFLDFSPYLIDTESFPYNVWRKISRNILLDDREELLLAGDGQGNYALRRVIADYLHQARGVNCNAPDIILGAGNEYLEILLTQLLGRGKTVLMEDPGYPQAYRTFSNMGYVVKTVSATEQGLRAEDVREQNPNLVYMMPSHQFPLGTVLPLGTRLELLKWATEQEERYLIEDDHDSEYRYRGKPIPSMQSVDHYGKVIYLGTFSKSVAPSIRISYMVLPPQLMERYHSVCGFYSATVPRMMQEILREFIQGGYFERHLNKMRGVYRNRHDFLIGELKKRSWVKRVRGDYAGLHVLVEVESALAEQEICTRAREMGVRVSGLNEYRLEETQHVPENGDAAERTLSDDTEKRQQPVLLLGYGKLQEEDLRQGLAVLDEVIKNK